MDNPEKLAPSKQDKGNQSKNNNTICVGNHSIETNTNNINKT